MAIVDHTDLRVYKQARALAKRIYFLVNTFPKEERYRLGDQAIRSSRSVVAAIPEAWRWRKYRFQFLSKLTEAEAETAETRAWLDVALDCGFIDEKVHLVFDTDYRSLIAQLVQFGRTAQNWTQFHPRDQIDGNEWK